MGPHVSFKARGSLTVRFWKSGSLKGGPPATEVPHPPAPTLQGLPELRLKEHEQDTENHHSKARGHRPCSTFKGLAVRAGKVAGLALRRAFKELTHTPPAMTLTSKQNSG